MNNEATIRTIKAAVVLAGTTYTEIGRQVGVTPGMVSNVVAGRFRSSKVEDALIALGIPAETFGPRRRPGQPPKK